MFFTFDKVSVLNGAEQFLKTGEPSKALGRKDEDIKAEYTLLTQRFYFLKKKNIDEKGFTVGVTS